MDLIRNSYLPQNNEYMNIENEMVLERDLGIKKKIHKN